MENTDINVETVGDAGQGPEGKGPDLTIADLSNMRAIIDMAVRRGAFGAAEASGVGQVFDKLNTFLNAVNPPKSEDQPAKQ